MRRIAHIGRFAPSPTGPLHAGSLVAALASWLDVRAHASAGQEARWLVRIEDVDTPRCVPGAAQTILTQLAACGLMPDAPPMVQSQRGTLYQAALDALVTHGSAYPCGCSRKDIEDAYTAQGLQRARHAELVYPGTCRDGLHGKPARAWRLRVPAGPAASRVHWQDRRLGLQQQDVAREVGDFVLQRADGLWAYQLAVVVDDAAQRITDVVRGEDLADNTARQIVLQRALGLPTPRYLHTPLVLAADGQKLSKQNGAQPLDTQDPLAALNTAAAVLGLPRATGRVADALAFWVRAWSALYNPVPVNDPISSPAPHDPADPKFDATADPRPDAPVDDSTAKVPPGVAFPKTIKSYVRRAGRTTTGQAKAFEELGPRFVLPYQASPLDIAAAFERAAPTVLEIGFGMGDATAHIAALMPEKNFLCCEVHEPGVGALLKQIGERALANIRILQHDAVEVLDHMLAPQSLAGVHIFFPDPWHKTKHNKRRLIQPPFVAKLAQRLAPGGYLHCATDWEPYAQQMLQVLGESPLLRSSAAGFADKPAYRPLTKFENRGLKLGHGVWDLVFVRV
jgi:glutamyl-Q tRNA(Asp) synthetase